MRIRLITAAVVSVALAAAGCGSNSSSSPGTSSPGTNPGTSSSSHQPTRAGLDSALNALCQHANSAFNSNPSKQAQAAIVAHFLASARSIKVPSQLQGTYSKYLSVIGQELADLKQGNTSGVFQLAHSKAKPLARQLGATGCVTGS